MAVDTQYLTSSIGEKLQVVIVDTDIVMETHQAMVRDLTRRHFPLALLIQFLVDYIVNEECRTSQQMQPLIMDWHAFIEDSILDVRPYEDLITSSAFDSFFYDLYLTIGRTQTILTAPFCKGAVGLFVFDGWVGSCFKLRRSTLKPAYRYSDHHDNTL